MRELSSVELDLIVGGYGEESGGGSFDEGAYAAQATLTEDGSYSVQVSEAEYDANIASANIASAQSDEWEITGEFHLPGGIVIIIRPSKSADAS